MLVLVNLWEKTALDFLVTSANASQNAKKNLALRGSPYFFVLVQKSDFSMGRGPILRCARVFEKKPAGYSFHVLVMQAHVRTGPETMPNVEIMWAKVRYFLSQVSLYPCTARSALHGAKFV